MKTITLIEVPLSEALALYREELDVETTREYLDGNVYIQKSYGLEQITIDSVLNIRELIHCKFYKEIKPNE